MEDESGPRYLKRLEMEEIELVQKLQNAERRQIPANELDFDKYERISLSLDIDRTGAQLIMREAVGYLYNFCSKLPAQLYVSNKPLFTYERNNYGRFRAVVKLPSNLDPSLQSFSSSRSWSRLKYAREDAALQAYKALYQAGLVNDYLVPTQVSDHLEGDIIFRSHYSIQNQLDPWQDIALLWKLDSQLLHCDALSTELSDFVQKSSEKADAIKHELWEQRFYPWVRLRALGDMRVLSDIIQSIFGAVFIDSQATLASCDALAEKLGIVPLLEHFISHQITTDHPKDTLQAILPGRKVSYQICVDKVHPGTLRCSALADSSEIASVEGQMNDEVIKMQAAETAVRLLRKGFALSETS
ncbi:hypothetical protein CBS115989_5044 [Aspergillus niger]|nr:hypothetical protein CBS115989_5044 [Aspergillus niger]KAI2834972.1 hypothetical protein CBS11232_10664 [Aspergillus niger]KAI2871968.1 hypothetical protein CBS115988_8196 [Aspergillus niger]